MTAPDSQRAPRVVETPVTGTEISVTGRWDLRPGRAPVDLDRVLADLQRSAASEQGVLTTTVDRVIGTDAALVHQVFTDPEALVSHVTAAGAGLLARLRALAEPDLHLVRGAAMPTIVQDTLRDTGLPAAVGEHRYGFVRDDRVPDPASAINVTAKWTALPDDPGNLDELVRMWRQVATDATTLEEGMLRFEALKVVGEDALIIHEVFEDTSELFFHLTRGTAARHKSAIDAVAAPQRYYFRGPVSWIIRTYSRFMRLPATYSRHVRAGGSRNSRSGSVSLMSHPQEQQ